MERARLSGALDPQAGFESLAGFIEGYATVIDAHPAFVRLVLRGVLDHGDVVYEKLLPRIAQVVPFVAGKIAKAQADGLLNPALEPAMVPPALIAPIIFFSIAHPLLSQVTGIPVTCDRSGWAIEKKMIGAISAGGTIAGSSAGLRSPSACALAILPATKGTTCAMRGRSFSYTTSPWSSTPRSTSRTNAGCASMTVAYPSMN